MKITKYKNTNGIAYYSRVNYEGVIEYSFSSAFEDTWDQDTQEEYGTVYMVIAHCRFSSQTYTLRNSGDKWPEDTDDETTFATRKEAEAFAENEADKVEWLVKMEMQEFNNEA